MAGTSSTKIALSISPQGSSLKMLATLLSYGELLIQILSWLPVDSLLRFRFVCKYWFDLITHDSSLAKMHLLHYHNLPFDKRWPTFLFSTENYETIYSLNFKNGDNDPIVPFEGDEFSFKNPCNKEVIDPSKGSELVHSFTNPKSTAKSVCHLDFLGSCNGLVCIKVYCHHEYQNIDKSTLYIWNPSTTEFKQIPDSPVECPMNFGTGRIDYYYDHRIRTTYGFGYDKNIDDYKVIRCAQRNHTSVVLDHVLGITECFCEPNEGNYHDLCSEVKVYTLGTNSWRRIHQQIPYRITKCRSISKPGLLVGGSLHWVAYRSRRFDRIISFDIVDEMYREVPKPELFYNGANHFGLQVLRGCLCLYYRHCGTLDFYIWMMMDYGVKESWTKLVTIHIPKVIEITWNLTPLWISKNGEILIGEGYRDLILWDPISNDTEFLWYRTVPDFEPSKISYIGSLVSLKSGTYMNRTLVKPDEDPQPSHRNHFSWLNESCSYKNFGKDESCSY